MIFQLQKDLAKFANKEKAESHTRFFKTKKGEYGQGDVFLGVSVPQQRAIAKEYQDLPLDKLQKLLSSKFHEYRLTALFIATLQYAKACKEKKQSKKKVLIDFYLKNTKHVNNWDLVDSSAYHLLGDYLLDFPKNQRKILYQLAASKNMWERRIAVIATYAFIKKGEFDHTLKISEMLLQDTHDLIHKAVGWMLREVGKKDQAVEEQFLKKHYKLMPRTMLRYAIEQFSEEKRRFYLNRG